MESSIYQDYQRALVEEEINNKSENESLLSELSKIVTSGYLSAIKDWMSNVENGIYGVVKIVDKPCGVWQDEECEYSDNSNYWTVLKGQYVNQSCGYTGDDYSGTLEIKLPNGKFLRANFSL
ncbi:hypothetical protein FCL53_10695 [Elizabethkingia meningoseptica]|uniref:hypothetical protein n=1 Tax=Elizabethkingia meningoseptica TaxID=238 RepID=UPI001365B30A|nr:hypothetical protein [Elizabethkingia meningoseptica]MVW92432.1 hypothetical protein [Elizabethkingia meningoseptica]